MELKSKTLTNYYSDNPDDYIAKYHHYNIVIYDESETEYKLLENDIKKLREYNQNDSIIYFSDIVNLKRIIENTNILKQTNDIYLRVRNNLEYQNFKKLDLDINLIVSIKDIKYIDISDSRIILQIDTIKELSIDDLNNLSKKYNIGGILVGQMRYITNDYINLLDFLSKQYNIDASNQLELEKNNEVTNDIYSVDLYKKIVENINSIIDINKSKDNIDTIRNIFYYLAENIFYDDNGVKKTNIESQNLLGPLFNKKAVCEGYSKLFKQILSLLGIESNIVIGGGLKAEGGHVWNQVKIDGEWYNADVTTQSFKIHNNESIDMFLVSDEYCLFKSSSPFAKKCLYSYNNKNKLVLLSEKLNLKELYEMYQDIPNGDNGQTNKAYGISYEEFKKFITNEINRKNNDITYEDTPTLTYIYYVNDKPVGFICLRTKIDDNWMKWSGNFYYSVRVSERKKGYATQMLKLGLNELKKLGFKEAYGQSSEGNVGSAKVIENNNGIFIKEVEGTRYYKTEL